MRLITALLALLILSLMMLAGCEKSEGPVVAEVDGKDITLDDFKEYYRYPTQNFASAQDEFDAKREALDSMMVTEMLIHTAHDKGMDDMPDVNKVLAASTDRFLLDALYQKEIQDKINVTDAEIKEFYDNQKWQVRAAHILVETEQEANDIIERIKNGEDFEELAYNLSIDPSAKRNRGDMGYFSWGSMVEEFERAAFSMEIGEISPPVKSPYGYHIIKVLDRHDSGYDENWNEAKPKIREQLEKRQRYALTNEFYERLKTKYPVTVDQSVADYVLHKREELYPPQIMSSIPRNDFDDEQLDKDEKALVLATWPGGQMSLGSYIVTARSSIPPYARPDFDNYDSLASVVFELNKMKILAQEANDLGLANSDFYKHRYELVREYTMADILRNDSIAPPVEPSEEELRTYFEAHKDDFSVPELVHVYEIQVSDEMLARQLARQIKSFADFKQQATKITERPGYRTKQGDLGFVEQRWYPEIFNAAYNAKQGEILGPIRTQGKYSVIYKVESTPRRYRDYLEAKKEITSQLKKGRRDELFNTWLAERRKQANIVVHEDVLWESIDRDAYGALPEDTSVVNP